MATASPEGQYSPASPQGFHYNYDSSPIYPDRIIQPLPKRRIRSRISSEAAKQILETSLLENLPRQEDGLADLQNGAAEDGSLDSQAASESYQFTGNQQANGIEEAGAGDARQSHWRPKASANLTPSRNGHGNGRGENTRHLKSSMPPPAISSGDSVDGYDSFENTNNKKKRKIPTSGSIGHHHSSLSNDLAQLDISARDMDAYPLDPTVNVALAQAYGIGGPTGPADHFNSSTNATRPRTSRSGNRRYSGRSPLTPSVNGYNNAQLTRSSSQTGGDLSAENVAALDNLSTPRQGQENSALPITPSSKKGNSAKTQFTFTCGSESASSMKWPGSEYPSPSDGRDEAAGLRGGGSTSARTARGMSTQGTQTSPSRVDHNNPPPQQGDDPQAPQQPRRPRRSLAKQLALAARERRLQQDYDNYNNPPKDDKIWICQFCEYESIFGHPPEALIRRYEIKDRRERRRLAEKRRLLEKAKMKNKKGKKGSKNKNANAAQTQQQTSKQRIDGHDQNLAGDQDQVSPDDEYLLDEYDDEPLPTPTLPSQQPSRIPQPIGQSKDQYHSPRPPAGSGTPVVPGGFPA